jgi:Domain of unknown function (DUF4864)
MFCKQCGCNHGSQVNFCPDCGYQVSEKDRQEYLSSQHPARWLKILFGMILVILAISIFLILFSDNMTEVVSDQLQAIKENKLTEAYYNYSSKSFQKATSLEEFREFFQSFPFFSHYQSVRFIQRDSETHTGYLKAMMMTDQGNEIPLEFELVKEGDQWLVDNMKFEDPELEEHEDDIFDDAPLRQTINDFMDQIRQRNLEKAYQEYTSQDFRKTTSFDRFTAFIKENPNFADSKLELGHLSFDNNIATMNGTLTGPDSKKLEVEYDLTEDNGIWKVFHVQIYHLNPEASSEMQFSKFVIGDELDDENLVKMPKTVFKDGAKEIFLNLYISHAEPGMNVEVVFEHVDTGSTIAPVSKRVSDEGDVILTFVFSPPDSGWPKGNYRLSATSSNGKNGSYNFKLEA